MGWVGLGGWGRVVGAGRGRPGKRGRPTALWRCVAGSCVGGQERPLESCTGRPRQHGAIPDIRSRLRRVDGGAGRVPRPYRPRAARQRATAPGRGNARAGGRAGGRQAGAAQQMTARHSMRFDTDNIPASAAHPAPTRQTRPRTSALRAGHTRGHGGGGDCRLAGKAGRGRAGGQGGGGGAQGGGHVGRKGGRRRGEA